MAGLFGGGASPQEAGYNYGAPGPNSPSGGYFTGSPEAYFQGGGNETGQYAQAIGGGTQALVSLLMGNKQLKMQKRITGLEHAQAKDEYENKLKDSYHGEVDALRDYDRTLPEMRGQMAGRGMENSSANYQAKSDLDNSQNLRLDALRRQRALMNAGWERQQQIWDLQKKMARAQQQAAAIAAGIDTAISVASIASDERIKKGVEPVDVLDVLGKLESLPIATWTYEWERDDVKHMGPMAQDFYRTFGLGEPDTGRPMTIAHVDLFGVLLASVKALAAHNRTLQQRVLSLERKVGHGR